jgi:hypothetical protein
MTRNIIQMHDDINRQIDFVNNPRFPSRDYDRAINLSIEEFVNDRYDNVKVVKGYSFDSVQRVKDELRTLVTTSTIVPVSDIVAIPATYKHFLQMLVTLDGIQTAVKSVSFDEISGYLNNTYTKPDADSPVITEDENGFKVYHGSSTLTSSDLTFLKTPAEVTSGLERQKISAGSGVLTAAATYIVIVDGTTHNSTSYERGETFAAANTNLTTGKVVLRTNTIDTDLPDTAHKEIVNRAAAIMEGWIDEFGSKQSLEFDTAKS